MPLPMRASPRHRAAMPTVLITAFLITATTLLTGAPAAADTGVTVSGTISAPEGAAIAGAEAELCRFDEFGTPAETGRVGTADSAGRFMITDVAPGDYTFVFRDPFSTVQNGTRFFVSRWYGDVKALGDACWQNPQADAGRFTVAGDPVDGLDGKLPIGGRLIGHTNDTRGEPVDDVQVTYTDAAGFDHGVRSGWPSGGEYRTNLVLPGEQQVTFFDGRDGARTTKSVTVAAGEPTRLDADFAKAELTPLGAAPRIGAPRTPAKGAQLAVDAAWSHVNATSSFAWLRDGRPIAGARDRAYRLTAADAGHTIGVRVTGRLKGYGSVTLTADNPVEFKDQDSTTTLMISPSSAPKDNPSVLHAYVHVALESGLSPVGIVTVWDDSHGEEEGRHIKIGEGKPNELGDVIITFPAELTLDGGEAYAEFSPDDSKINTSYSAAVRYRIG